MGGRHSPTFRPSTRRSVLVGNGVRGVVARLVVVGRDESGVDPPGGRRRRPSRMRRSSRPAGARPSATRPRSRRRRRRRAAAASRCRRRCRPRSPTGRRAISRAVSAGLAAASLSPTMLGTSWARRSMRLGRHLAAGATGDVVDEHRQVGRRGDGPEVRLESRLRRAVVVRRHRQDGVDAGLGRPTGLLDGGRGGVGAGAGRSPAPSPPRGRVRNSTSSSDSVSVGLSPVVPASTRPSLPFSTSQWASSTAASRSRSPRSSKGVTIAVTTRPMVGLICSSPFGGRRVLGKCAPSARRGRA